METFSILFFWFLCIYFFKIRENDDYRLLFNFTGYRVEGVKYFYKLNFFSLLFVFLLFNWVFQQFDLWFFCVHFLIFIIVTTRINRVK